MIRERGREEKEERERETEIVENSGNCREV